MKTKSAATLTVHDPAGMSAKGRRSVVKWLKHQAVILEKCPKQLSKRWIARYLYEVK